MAKLRVFCDMRYQKGTTFPVVIRVTNGATTAHIPLHISLRKEQWKDGKVVCHPQARMLNSMISQRLAYYELKLAQYAESNPIRQLSARQLRDVLVDENEAAQPILFVDYARKFIETRKARSTIGGYKFTLKEIEAFTDTSRLFLNGIDVSFLRNLQSHLLKKFKHNTVVIVFNHIRAIINAAIDDEIISPDAYPFRRFHLSFAPTRKRSLTIDYLRMLRDYDLSDKPSVERYRDIWMLSFYFAGINMADLLFLKSIRADGKIAFTRRKTGIPCEMIVPKEAATIINRYRGKEYLLNVMDTMRNHSSFTGLMNNSLSSIHYIDDKGKEVYPFAGVTSYWARHTWATIASDLDVPDAVIDMALGHKSPYPMSDVYIHRNQKKVDEAILKVIEYVNAKK